METVVESKKGYKKTKLGWIPEEWNEYQLGNIVKYTKGFAFKSKDYVRSGTRVIRISDTNANGIKEDGGVYIAKCNAGKFSKWKLRKGDIIFTTVGSRPPMYDSMVGKVIQVKKEYENSLLNQNAVILRSDEKIYQSLLIYFFKQKRYLNYIETIVRGNANQVSITLEDLFKYKLPIPPLPEQEKIGVILSTWDEAIETTTQLISQLKNRKKGMMQQLLTGKKRLPGFTEEWEEKKLGDFFNERKETNCINLKLLSIGKEGVYPQDTNDNKDTSNADKSKYKKICVGDIGYNTMRMWQGRSALSSLEGIVSPAYTIVTPKENASSLFFSYLFKLEETIHKFYRNSQGMVSDTWMCKFKDFSIVKFIAPTSIKEQQAIAQVLQTAEQEIIAQEQKLQALQTQKKGLMQQLLTGQTRVKV